MASLEPLSHANLYCSNLPETLTEADAVKQLFAPYGDVRSVRVVNFQRSSGNKIFAFVCMHNAQQAAAALAGLDQSVVQGHQLTVKLADGDISERAANKVVRPNSTLYVKYPANVSLEQLRGVFLPYGKVIDIRELGNRASMSSTVICSAALVELESTACATAAINDLHNRELPGSGTSLVVRFAYPQRNISSKPTSQRQQQQHLQQAGSSTSNGPARTSSKQQIVQHQRHQAPRAWQQHGPLLPPAAWQSGPGGHVPYLGGPLQPPGAGPYGGALTSPVNMHPSLRQQQQQQHLYESYPQHLTPPGMYFGPPGASSTGPAHTDPYAGAAAPRLGPPMGHLQLASNMNGPGAAAQPPAGMWPVRAANQGLGRPAGHPATAAAGAGVPSGLALQMRPPHLLYEPPGLNQQPAGMDVMGYSMHAAASMANVEVNQLLGYQNMGASPPGGCTGLLPLQQQLGGLGLGPQPLEPAAAGGMPYGLGSASMIAQAAALQEGMVVAASGPFVPQTSTSAMHAALGAGGLPISDAGHAPMQSLHW